MSEYRWNAATRPAVPGDHVVGICKGGHDSTETPCEYQPITEADVLELVEAVAAAQAEARELREDGALAARWAHSSAHHSQRLVDLFGPEARVGITLLEQQAEELQAEARELRAELARVRELCPEVIAFAHLMQHKLNMNAHKDGEGWGRDSSGKRGWKSCSPQFLMDKLHEEALELTSAIHAGDSAKSIRQEAADVGNIAMMLADVCGALSQPAPAPELLVIGVDLAAPGADRTVKAVIKQPPEHESLPLMARRSWMRRDTDYFVVHGDFCLEIKALNGRAPYYDEGGELLVCAEARYLIERDQVDAEAQPDGIYRIADTDEHGLPVIERTADMPEGAKYRITYITQEGVHYTGIPQLALEASRSGAVSERIEDYRESGKEGQE